MKRFEIESPVTGSVWKVECVVGQSVNEDDALFIIESMKMEIPVESEVTGVIQEILVREGDAVEEGQSVCVISLP